MSAPPQKPPIYISKKNLREKVSDPLRTSLHLYPYHTQVHINIRYDNEDPLPCIYHEGLTTFTLNHDLLQGFMFYLLG